MHLTSLPRPFIIAVATDRSVESTSTTIQNAAEQGAHAVELNLPAIADITTDELQALVDTSPIPLYTTCRRAPFMTVYGFALDSLPAWSDDERMERQLAAIHTGVVAIDIEMDTFDPNPPPPLGTPESIAFAASPGPAAELSHDRAAVSRQREIIAEAHTAGADVILSCHTGRPQSAEQLVQIAHEAVDRGGDLLKIVTPCRHSSDLVALLDATAQIRDSLPIPFILVGAGKAGRISRLTGTQFGSSWTIAQTERKPGGFAEQPTIAEASAMTGLLSDFVEVTA